ncbi:MAG: hypothetical protein MI748_13520, partial [Opitutales bacterium]|nr:hypothetical protein [Opitutales bacterium]
FSDPAEVIDHVALEEIYKPTPKKTHRRSKKEKRFVVLHPPGTETMDLFDESSGSANKVEFLEYNPSIAIKHALESSNADFVVIARNGLLFEPEFLKAAAESLTRNPDLSAVGCYIDGLRKYPFGYFQAGQALLNCGSPFANVYRKSSLLSILEEGETVPSNEWEWLIRLQQKFLTFDVLGSSLAHFENSTELAEQDTPLTTLSDLLQKHSRFWISNASRMLLWTIHNPHLLELGANAGESEDRVSGFVIPGLDEFFLESESEVVIEKKPSETPSTDSSTENNDHETPDEEEPTLSLIEDTEEEQIAGLQEESPEPIAFEPDPGEEMPAEEATEEDTSEEVKEDRPVLLQIFWAEEGAFSEEDSITEIYEPENAMNFDVDIESIYNFNYLRLDLSNQPGVITLESIEIFDDLSQEVVFLANEENAFSNITPAGDVEVEGIELNTLELKAIGDDPQILISFDDISLRSARVSMKFGFRKAEFER